MTPPLVCHVIYRLDYGGLENGLVNLINGLPPAHSRHAVVCLAGFGPFRERLRPGVEVLTCDKRPGQDPALYYRLWRLFRRLRPAVVHTRNLATLEAQLAAAAAGVPVRVHGEHGHDVHDLDNRRRRYRWLRQAFRPLVTQYVSVSRLLERFLVEEVGVPGARVTRICNGVDCERFAPRAVPGRPVLSAAPFDAAERLVIGSVGRMQAVKDPLNLVRAFIEILRREPAWRSRLALVMVGDGALRGDAEALLAGAGLRDLAWLPGARDDTPELLNAFDVFVLPSLGEGISNTILEAMACGKPVVATDVGGNAELVVDGATGRLVPRADHHALAAALMEYVAEPARIAAHGLNARARAADKFSLRGMTAAYQGLYDRLLVRAA